MGLRLPDFKQERDISRPRIRKNLFDDKGCAPIESAAQPLVLIILVFDFICREKY